MVSTDYISLAVNAAFVGIGVAIGGAVVEVWIKPYIKKLHKVSKGASKHFKKMIIVKHRKDSLIYNTIKLKKLKAKQLKDKIKLGKVKGKINDAKIKKFNKKSV
jgi:hypothetical protein